MGPRKPKSLPALPSAQLPGATGSGSATVSPEQVAQIAEKREEAARRKEEKQRRAQAMRSQPLSGDEDPLGLGFSLDG